jgi:hypothetical protein
MRLEQAEQRVTSGDSSDEALLELEEAAKQFEAAGGYTQEQVVATVLKGLGFLESDYGAHIAFSHISVTLFIT